MLWSAVLVVLLADTVLLRAATLLSGITVLPRSPDVQWGVAHPLVEPLLHEVDVVITMADLDPLSFQERDDVLFSPARLSEITEAEKLAADCRTGRPVISTQDSLARLIDCTLTASSEHRHHAGACHGSSMPTRPIASSRRWPDSTCHRRQGSSSLLGGMRLTVRAIRRAMPRANGGRDRFE